MAIDVSALQTIKGGKYNASGSADFIAAFFEAFYRICQDLMSDKVGLTITTIPTLANAADLDIDDIYYNVVSDGLDYYIQNAGLWGKDEDRKLESLYERRLGEAHTEYLKDTTHYTRMQKSP